MKSRRDISFLKYQGTGNDFVLIDDRSQSFLDVENQEQIALICNRKFGIGADGLILLRNHPEFDFEMVYYNADGRLGSMCGNGGRCIVAFARHLQLIEHECTFLAADGIHRAKIIRPNWIELSMNDVTTLEENEDYCFLNTGSPHYVVFTNNLEAIDIVEQGRAIRYSERFRKEGTNVNFVEPGQNQISVATYERGVEDETLSCGTGVTAAAIAYYLQHPDEENPTINIRTKGGSLEVKFRNLGNHSFTDIWLCGPAVPVFEGHYLG